MLRHIRMLLLGIYRKVQWLGAQYRPELYLRLLKLTPTHIMSSVCISQT